VVTYRRAAARNDLTLADGERFLSGGTWLFSEPQPGTTGLVDLTGLGWTPWERTDQGLLLAATCTVEELLAVPVKALGRASELVSGAPRRC
jgi:xanthine dehydrogenase FAD-binding subunit